MQLSRESVDRIHTRLLARYGVHWNRQWEGIDPELVKADWSRVLGGLSSAALIHALDHLPEKVPTSSQFRTIALGVPVQHAPAIAGPEVKADKARMVEVFKRWHELAKARNPLSWAHDLEERERRGEDLTPIQRAAWRNALQSSPILPTAMPKGSFRGIDAADLPPGMRKTQGGHPFDPNEPSPFS